MEHVQELIACHIKIYPLHSSWLGLSFFIVVAIYLIEQFTDKLFSRTVVVLLRFLEAVQHAVDVITVHQ
jgi:hypothetical protein